MPTVWPSRPRASTTRWAREVSRRSSGLRFLTPSARQPGPVPLLSSPPRSLALQDRPTPSHLRPPLPPETPHRRSHRRQIPAATTRPVATQTAKVGPLHSPPRATASMPRLSCARPSLSRRRGIQPRCSQACFGSCFNSPCVNRSFCILSGPRLNLLTSACPGRRLRSARDRQQRRQQPRFTPSSLRGPSFGALRLRDQPRGCGGPRSIILDLARRADAEGTAIQDLPHPLVAFADTPAGTARPSPRLTSSPSFVATSFVRGSFPSCLNLL